jgi:hypothetical protein
LAQLAERTGVAVILVRHLNKKTGADPLYRDGGSIAFVGAARVAYIVGEHPADSSRRVLAPVKCNIAKSPSSWTFRLVSGGGGGVRVEWEGSDSISARALLDKAKDRGPTKLETACDFLMDAVSNGPKPVLQVQAEAEQHGIAPRTLARARQIAPVEPRREGFGEGAQWVLCAVAPDARQHTGLDVKEPMALYDDVHLYSPTGTMSYEDAKSANPDVTTEEELAERAAILEFDGGLTRVEAEELAAQQVVAPENPDGSADSSASLKTGKPA